LKERKYKEDYGFETYFDDKGHEKRRAVYRGEWYSMDAQDEKMKISVLIPFALCAIAYLIYMKFNTPSGRCMYVLPPAACALIPLVYWAMGIFALLRNPAKMTRLQKENGPGRVLRSAIGAGVLLAMAVVGDIIFIFTSPTARENGELAGFVFLAIAAACAFGGFIRARAAFERIQKTDPPRKEACK